MKGEQASIKYEAGLQFPARNEPSEEAESILRDGGEADGGAFLSKSSLLPPAGQEPHASPSESGTQVVQAPEHWRVSSRTVDGHVH